MWLNLGKVVLRASRTKLIHYHTTEIPDLGANRPEVLLWYMVTTWYLPSHHASDDIVGDISGCRFCVEKGFKHINISITTCDIINRDSSFPLVDVGWLSSW